MVLGSIALSKTFKKKKKIKLDTDVQAEKQWLQRQNLRKKEDF